MTQQLQDIFLDEAGAHLRALRACLDRLDEAAQAASALEVLHTLAGAARAAGHELVERLARACEELLRGGAGPDDAALLRQAADLVWTLVQAPTGRARNEALALAHALDAAAARRRAAREASR